MIKALETDRFQGFYGTPEGNRTPSLTLRRGALYPIELLALIQIFTFFEFTGSSSFHRLGGRCSIQLSYWRIS